MLSAAPLLLARNGVIKFTGAGIVQLFNDDRYDTYSTLNYIGKLMGVIRAIVGGRAIPGIGQKLDGFRV